MLNKAAFRSSRPELFLQKGALERRSKSRGEHVCGSVMAIEITLPHGLSLALPLPLPLPLSRIYCMLLCFIISN